MGIFDGKKEEQIKYLDEERKKAWERITKLETDLSEFKKLTERRTPEAEKEAKEHSRKAAEFRNKTEDRFNEASQLLSKFQEFDKNLVDINAAVNQFNTEFKSLQERTKVLEAHILSFDQFFENHDDIQNELQQIETLQLKIAENEKKSAISLNNINTKIQELDELYYEILGYTDTQDDGTEIEVPGKKEQLEKVYDSLSKQMNDANTKISNINKSYKEKFEEFRDEHEAQYDSILNKINTLLPNALTAGLSAAFAAKKTAEENAAQIHQSKFQYGIYGLIGISCLPVIVSIVFLMKDVQLADVITRIPRLVLAFIPIYIPVMWLTYSANKKLNLSKRLIEEYAHKEVLSKTYEGLATQINNIEDEAASEELKVRLLHNLLQVSAENPGKLISNYSSSDHPIMEALEQSYKLQIAIDKLETIPGMGKIAAIFEKKSKRKLEEKEEKVNKALEV